MENTANSNTGLSVRGSFNVFAKPDLKGILLIGKPNQYLADCSTAGQFKDKKGNMLGKELKMEILNVTKMYGKFFKYDPQEWVEILFVDKDNAVSTVLVKTQSIDNFYDCIANIIKSGKAVGEVVVTAKMVAQFSERNGSKYSAIEFTFEDNKPERAKELQKYLADNPDILSYSLLCEMLNRSEHVDTNTGEIIESETIKENGNQFKATK